MTRRSFVACKSINRSHRGNRSLHTLVGPDVKIFVSPNRPQPKHARGVGCLLQGCRCQRSTPAPAAASAVPLACRHGLLADQVVDDAVKNLDETLRAEEPGDTAVPEDTIDVDSRMQTRRPTPRKLFASGVPASLRAPTMSSACIPVRALIPAAGFNSQGCAGFYSELPE